MSWWLTNKFVKYFNLMNKKIASSSCVYEAHKSTIFSLNSQHRTNAMRWKEKHKIWSDFLPLQIKKNEFFSQNSRVKIRMLSLSFPSSLVQNLSEKCIFKLKLTGGKLCEVHLWWLHRLIHSKWCERKSVKVFNVLVTSCNYVN